MQPTRLHEIQCFLCHCHLQKELEHCNWFGFGNIRRSTWAISLSRTRFWISVLLYSQKKRKCTFLFSCFFFFSFFSECLVKVHQTSNTSSSLQTWLLKLILVGKKGKVYLITCVFLEKSREEASSWFWVRTQRRKLSHLRRRIWQISPRRHDLKYKERILSWTTLCVTWPRQMPSFMQTQPHTSFNPHMETRALVSVGATPCSVITRLWAYHVVSLIGGRCNQGITHPQ